MNLITRLFIVVAVVFFTISLNMPTIHSVVIALVGITFSSLSYYYENNNKFHIIYSIVIICLIIYNLNFLWLALFIIYDFYHYKFKYLFMFILAFVVLFINHSVEERIIYIFWIALIYFLAYLNNLYLQTKKVKEALEIEKLVTLDKLGKQNKSLIESQDQQISYAKLNERGRIARDIHDSVGHLLSSSILQLGAIKAINQDEALKPMITNLDQSLNEAMSSIRHSIFQMHSSSINLQQAINEVILLYPDYNFNLYYDINNEMSSKLKATFLSIIKEAINNTIKHSNATTIKIVVRELTSHYQLIIHDNGHNINPNFKNGIGLMSIEERIALYNGILTINTDDGFKIFISITKEE